MRLRLLAQAESESQRAADRYESKQSGLGAEFFDELASAFESIERDPTRRNLRRVILKRFPYSVAYEILATEVLVLAIAHTSRRPNYWSRRRG